MRIKTTFFLCVLVLALAACDKNQSKVRKVDGRWEVTYAEWQGYGGYDYPGIVFDFNSCKLRKNGGYCDFSYEDVIEGDFDGVYNVTHNGDQLNMTIKYNTGQQPYSFDIKSLSDEKMVLVNLKAEQNKFKRIEMTKQE